MFQDRRMIVNRTTFLQKKLDPRGCRKLLLVEIRNVRWTLLVVPEKTLRKAKVCGEELGLFAAYLIVTF
jgi:hypothetical protein